MLGAAASAVAGGLLLPLCFVSWGCPLQKFSAWRQPQTSSGLDLHGAPLGYHRVHAVAALGATGTKAGHGALDVMLVGSPTKS